MKWKIQNKEKRNMNSVKDKLKLEIPEDPDIDKDPKEYIKVYGVHSLLKRLWDMGRSYVDKGVVDFNAMKHHIIVTYTTRDLKVDGENLATDELSKLDKPADDVRLKVVIHTEIVPNAKKFYDIVNKFYDEHNCPNETLFARLVKDGYLSHMPEEVLAIMDVEWDKSMGVKYDIRTITGLYGYSYVDEKEIKALNEILDTAELFKANAKAAGRVFETDFSWTNYYCHIDNGGYESIYGPMYVQPESVLEALSVKDNSISKMVNLFKKLFKRN